MSAEISLQRNAVFGRTRAFLDHQLTAAIQINITDAYKKTDFCWVFQTLKKLHENWRDLSICFRGYIENSILELISPNVN